MKKEQIKKELIKGFMIWFWKIPKELTDYEPIDGYIDEYLQSIETEQESEEKRCINCNKIIREERLSGICDNCVMTTPMGNNPYNFNQ